MGYTYTSWGEKVKTAHRRTSQAYCLYKLKLRYLTDVQLKLPSSHNGTENLGHFHSKKTDYDVHVVGTDAKEAAVVGAGELHGLAALLPDRKKRYTGGPLYSVLPLRSALT